MQKTDIVTRESDLVIVCGDSVIGEPSKAALASVKYIFTDLTDIRKFYIRLGFHLDEFRRNYYHRDFGFYTLEDFCEKNLAMDKGAVSRCINVYKEFNASNDVSYIGGGKTVGSAMDLSEKWKDFSYTQLCELLPMSEDDRKKVTPDMTVKQIREYKKSLKGKPAASTQPETSDGGSVASTQPKKPFDKKKYDNTMGAARQNVVRSCSAVNDNVIFNVFDKNGKFLGGNIWCELIYKSGHEFYFRLCQARDEKKEE